MDRILKASLSRPWRPLSVGLFIFLALSLATLWNWSVLERRTESEMQNRFVLDMQAARQRLQMRMQSYEMVLHGLAGTFVSGNTRVTYQHWHEIVEQFRVWEVYPGISSLVWARYLRSEAEKAEFITRTRAEGRPDYRILSDTGPAQDYLPVEFIGPLNARTKPVEGIDLLQQQLQQDLVRQAIATGQTILSPPLPDLYALSVESVDNVGLLLFLPVYQTGKIPNTEQERRANFVGMVDAAFRAQDLANGIFGAQLRMLRIRAWDMQQNASPIFDTAPQPSGAAPDWRPRFHGSLQLPLYGRTWRLEFTGTPEYEETLALGRSNAFTLILGLASAFLMASLAGGFIWHRDRELHIKERIAARLREQAQQLMLASRYKSEFLANMSHELRTPLNSILILSDQLRQNAPGNLNEKQTRHADIVYRAGSDLLQLINDVLDLAKIEAGRVQLSLEPTRLQDLLIDLDASMRPLAEAKHLHLHIASLTPDSGVPQRVFTDRVRLHQILRNLLSNAIKFTDQGQVALTVSVEDRLPGDKYLICFAVRDTGIGIAKNAREQVFEAFQQLDGSTRRRFGGTGLGLPITRQLAHALDGEVSLESTPGQGSTFSVRLPMQSVPDLPAEKVIPPQRAGSGPALLIVEDDDTSAQKIIEQAHAAGFSSVRSATGTQALDLLKNETFAAVVLDILLPDISGWQVFKHLRALPAHRHTPVHIVSSLPEPSGMVKDANTHYLTKPLNRETLEQVFASLDTAPGQGPALLLVEDSAVERAHYRQQLETMGFIVTACESGCEARMLWRDNRFAVLVIDLNLPDEDGFTLLDALEQLHPLNNTKVVINTGIDVDQHSLQRLHSYSAVVVHKRGESTAVLEQAVQGFLNNVSAAIDGYVAPTHDTAPQAISAPMAVTPAPCDDSPALPSLQDRRIMLVDDDIRNVYAMSALLDDFGLQISTAANGEEAIARFLQEPPDLILMDMSMPVMDGYTATHLLKTQHGCTVPIIALTAHAMKGDREKCMTAGADDYLAKPVERDELRSMLERWLAISDATPPPAS